MNIGSWNQQPTPTRSEIVWKSMDCQLFLNTFDRANKTCWITAIMLYGIKGSKFQRGRIRAIFLSRFLILCKQIQQKLSSLDFQKAMDVIQLQGKFGYILLLLSPQKVSPNIISWLKGNGCSVSVGRGGWFWTLCWKPSLLRMYVHLSLEIRSYSREMFTASFQCVYSLCTEKSWGGNGDLETEKANQVDM